MAQLAGCACASSGRASRPRAPALHMYRSGRRRPAPSVGSRKGRVLTDANPLQARGCQITSRARAPDGHDRIPHRTSDCSAQEAGQVVRSGDVCDRVETTTSSIHRPGAPRHTVCDCGTEVAVRKADRITLLGPQHVGGIAAVHLILYPPLIPRLRPSGAVRTDKGANKGALVYDRNAEIWHVEHELECRTGVWYRIPDARCFRVMRANLGRLSTFESLWEA